MNLILQRRAQDPHSTPGVLGIEGVQECLTLEPLASGVQFPRIAAGGPWPVTLRPSPKFQQIALGDPWFKPFCDLMPHIEYKPGSVTMIHPGNLPGQTEDCVLVGETRGPDFVAHSRPAFAALWQKLAAATEPIMITIVDAENNAEDVNEAGDPG